MDKKPLILIANDDGYRAKGFQKLIELMRRIGEVVAVSTEKSVSGQSHSVTNNEPLRAYLFEQDIDYKLYVCTDRPVDCIKIGYKFTDGRMPDLVVSGINHGSNASANVIYSGTMGAALEACMDGVPAIGFSVDSYSSKAAFDHIECYVDTIARRVLKEGLPKGVCLNVNMPKKSDEPIKGVKICRQAKGRWNQAFEQRVDPYGRDYYWLTGCFIGEDDGVDTDLYAIKNNYIAIVPIMFDMTSYSSMEMLKEWSL